MSEHFPLRSSVGSRGSALPSHHYHVTPQPRPHDDNPDPLASVWIRRLHHTHDPPPQQPPPPAMRDAVSTRSTGFGPLRWSPRPLRDEPAGAWDAGPVPGGGGGGPPMLSPFFRFPPPVAEIGNFMPVRQTIGFGSISGGFPGLASRTVVGGDHHDAWLATRAAGSTYPGHAVDMVPIRTSHDLHVRQHTMIPQNFGRHDPHSSSMIPQNFARPDPSSSSMIPQNFARPDPSSSSMIPQNFARHDPSSSSMIAQNFARHPNSRQDEPFSYWNMGRFQRSTTISSISQIAAAPGNFVRKRSADSSSFLPLKFRKLSGSG